MVDSSSTVVYKFKNQNDAQAPKKHTVIAVAKKILVPIDEDIANRLGIKDGDIVSEVEDGTDTIKLIFKDIKNRNGRPEAAQQPEDQGYKE
ncbi:MAG TPA: hypothetical protein VE544_11275 [Nitrososphaeraceae archaeon]|nr:hypothetical protein [Nitrososphaeraceae archaeon]